MMIVGRYQESEAQLRKALELDPNFQIGYLSLANTQMLQGRYAESVENFAKAREVARRPDHATAMRASSARGGWRGFVMDLETNDWLSDPTTEYIDACRMASIGENDLALDRLEKSARGSRRLCCTYQGRPASEATTYGPAVCGTAAKSRIRTGERG